MEDKDVEKNLISALEDKSQLNQSVLNAAKTKMQEKKRANHQRVIRYSVGFSAVAAVLCIVVILSVVFGSYKTVDYSSMKDYLYDKDIPIKTFDKVKEKNEDIPGVSYPNGASASYERIECKLIKRGGKDFCIKESYSYNHQFDKVENYIVLNSNKQWEERYFSDFANLDKKTTIEGVNIEYCYDESKVIGCAKFQYGGYTFYMTSNAKSEVIFTRHLNNFIKLQKN